MKKILILLILLLPINVYCKTFDISYYNTKNTIETFEEENISFDIDDYTESDDMITIYIFRGHECSFSNELLNYLATELIPKYKDKVKIVSFEVWNDTSNATLMANIKNMENESFEGVPYYFIGTKSFQGYSEAMNNQIELAITSLLNKSNYDDIFTKYNSYINSKDNTNKLPILIIIMIILIAFAIYVFKPKKKKVSI